ncbi:hypothetical protein D3C73_1230150 [compost metagenome]
MDVNSNYFVKYLEQIDSRKNSKEICDELYKYVLRENKDVLKDDLTIIVSKIKEN